MFTNTWNILVKYWPLYMEGLLCTVELTLIAVAVGTVLGAGLAVMRLAKNKLLRGIASVYVEIIRDTPILLQLYFFYFLLPEILPSMDLSKFTCIAVALVFNSAAYMSEVIRSGIQAVDRGQAEAARSLGLSAGQTMLRIVLPQAIRNLLPALCNEFVAVLKETSLASTFYVGDLMTKYNVISGKTYMAIEPLIIAGIIYFVIALAISKGVNKLEKHLKEGE